VITVVIPVGPNESNTRWLLECLASVERQTLNPSEVLLIDDSGEKSRYLPSLVPAVAHTSLPLRIWKSPWRTGVASAFNVGIAEAIYDLVFMLGSDDTLEPDCLEACVEEYRRKGNDNSGYYSVAVRYMDTGEVQTAPCHASMVTKQLWRHTGGFPVETASGAPDAALLSILFAHGGKAGWIYPVADGRPLYNYRRHNETDTARRGPWQGVILATRDIVTARWQPGGAK
jgi:glycosyltransferase involved in cell wall biosynthesis